MRAWYNTTFCPCCHLRIRRGSLIEAFYSQTRNYKLWGHEICVQEELAARVAKAERVAGEKVSVKGESVT